MGNFSITIAVPTYNRPELLHRTLLSIEKQTVNANEVIVSDNATPGAEVEKVIEYFIPRIPNLRYIKQEVNIGAEANFFGCIKYAESDLFMWVADDDELSPDCLEELIQMFNTIPDLATAVPQWHFYTDLDTFKVMPARSYDSSNWILRVSKFMYKATDELFYGLHKRSLLTTRNLETYFWPNKKETLNLVYPYLLQMVIAGKVIVTDNKNAYWKNHDYGVKYHAENYQEAKKKLLTTNLIEKASAFFKFFVRRINLQILYLKKISTKGGLGAVVLLFPISVAAVINDFFNHIYELVIRAIKVRSRG